MKIIRAEHMGMCFGVRDAIQLVQEQSKQGAVTVLGELVHNETVIARLRAQGVQMQKHPDEVTTPTAIITAHGASERFMSQARAPGLRLLEATCPLVRVAHQAIARLVEEGFHPVIIGKRDHVEVRGMTEDLEEFDVVLTEQDVRGLRARPKFGVGAQTTQPIDRVRELVARIQARFPDSQVRFADTVCQPTKQRQSAAIELAKRCDMVVVVGGAHSNNTRELVETSRRYCSRVFHVQGPNDLQSEWFHSVGIVGLTAGTSTPDELIDAVERRLREFAQSVQEVA